ncbi:tRNA (N(6)-L-threonylcarbamoyladenosine(37)-C(2))-methylthiotransferase [Candidatus Heimdallarchaeota archaeon]|nr:MAG: tRNA (N(6)-L-threonylcarbamoyladenosine(37)-C(2))-methylthiotransferase [Candidatus Heimdallarchaeota archaeon]
MTTFFLETYGCTANTSAAELMSYLLLEAGFEKSTSIANADLLIINTCIVKAPTENKIKYQLEQLAKLDKPLIVTSCLSQVMNNWCQEKIPQASLLGVDHFKDILLAAEKALEGERIELLTRESYFPKESHRNRFNHLTGIIELSKGCLGKCTYCIVKEAKGKLVSKTEQQILKEVETALAEGCKELWLTAQDIASYGLDINKSLLELLKKIINYPQDFMIRLGMMTPNKAFSIIDDLVEVYSSNKVYSFAHLPVQSGSDLVLKQMKRQYTIEEFKEVITKLKKENAMSFSTDIIAGFPGERRKDHELTKSLLKEIKFDIVNISKYGDRPGTIASRSKNKIPTQIIKKRSKEISRLVAQITKKRNKQYIGWKGEGLALAHEEKERNTLLRTPAYKLVAIPEILPLGKKYKLIVTGATKTRLMAEHLLETPVKTVKESV